MTGLWLVVLLSTQTTAASDISGRWKLISDESDSPWELIQESLGRKVEVGSRTEGSWGMSSLAGSQSRDDLSRRLLRFAGAIDLVTIKIIGNRIQLEPHGLARDSFTLDGRSRPHRLPDGGVLETSAERRGDEIVIERRSKVGAIFTESYSLSTDGSKLSAQFHLDSEILDKPLTIRCAYRRLNNGGR